MDADLPPLNPKDTTNFLLGGMQKQLEAIALEQAHARDSGEKFREEVRASVAEVAAQGAATASDVAILKSKQAPRVHWLTILVGIVAVFGATLALLDRLYQ